MLKIFLGKAKTGKTNSILECVIKDIKEKLSPLLIAPTRMRRDSFVKKLAVETKGFAGKAVYTLSEAVNSIVDKSDFSLHHKITRINDFESYLFVKRAIAENKNKFKYFKNIETYSGVEKLIYSLIMEMRAGVVLSGGKSNLSVLRQRDNKWADIALIYNEYEKILMDNHLFDTYWLFHTVSEILDNEEVIDNTSLYIDGFFDFTNSQFNFIKSLINNFGRHKKEAVISLLDLDFEITRETLERFKREFKNVEIVHYKWAQTGEKTLFQPAENSFLNIGSSILEKLKKDAGINSGQIHNSIFEINAFGKYREVELIANEIKRLIHEEGYKYNDIALIVRNIDLYDKYIWNVFYNFQIPFFQSKDEMLRNNPAIILLHSIIRYSFEGIDNIGILSVAGSSYNTNKIWKKLISIDRYFKEYVKGGKSHWLNEIDNKITFYKDLKDKKNINTENNSRDLSAEDIEIRIETMQIFKEELTSMLETIFALKQNKTYSIGNYITWVADIVDKLGIYHSLNEYAVKNSNEHNIITRDFMAFRKLKEVLISLKKSFSIYKEKDIGLSEFFNVFSELIKEVRYRYRYYPIDSVKILTPFDSRETSFKAVFILGLNEGEFPGKPSSSILDNAERRYFNARAKAILLDENENKLKRERLNFYIAVTRCADNLYLCHTPFDESGELILPSLFLQNFKQKIDPGSIRYIPDKSNNEPYSDNIFEIIPSQNWMNINDLRILINNDIKNIDNKTKKELTENYPEFGFIHLAEKMIEYSENIENINLSYINEAYFEQLDKNNLRYFGVLPSFENKSGDKKNTEYIREKLKNRVFSASSLETAGNCRYHFFFKYILNIEAEQYPLREIELRFKGKFYHNVLQIYVNSTKDMNAEDLPYIPALKEAVELTYEEMREREGYTKLLKIEKEFYIKELIKFAAFEADSRNYYSPVGFEFSFNDKLIAGNKNILFTGLIDRVDKIKGDKDIYRIVDCKTGSTVHFNKDMEIPLKLFQGYVYAKFLNKPVGAITFMSIKKCESAKVYPIKKNTAISFNAIWDQKAKEIEFLIDTMSRGNFNPFSTGNDFFNNDDLLKFYTDTYGEDVKFESVNKCGFCDYVLSCRRKYKLRGYHR